MTRADRETLAHAAALLDGQSLVMMALSTRTNDPAELAANQRVIDDLRATAIRLYDIAETA